MSEIDLNPGRLFSLASGYWQPCALHAAVKLEIFTRLGGGDYFAGQLAEKLGASERGVSALLNALVAMELLRKEDGRYSNTPLAAAFLDKNSPRYVGFIIMHHHHMVDAWNQLDRAVISGRPVEKRDYGEERERESFLMGMFNLAMAIAPELAKLVGLAGRKHLLDLGGGPGTYAIHFCMANPDLQATIFDRLTTRDFAERTAGKFGLADRVHFAGGDFNRDPIPGRYDAAWLSHILHSNGPEECQALIRKTAQVLEPGGLLLIHDFFLNDTMDGPLFPALFSLNMLTNNHGRSYSEQEVRAMMEAAGVVNIRRLAFEAPNDSGVLCGEVGG